MRQSSSSGVFFLLSPEYLRGPNSSILLSALHVGSSVIRGSSSINCQHFDSLILLDQLMIQWKIHSHVSNKIRIDQGNERDGIGLLATRSRDPFDRSARRALARIAPTGINIRANRGEDSSVFYALVRRTGERGVLRARAAVITHLPDFSHVSSRNRGTKSPNCAPIFPRAAAIGIRCSEAFTRPGNHRKLHLK